MIVYITGASGSGKTTILKSLPYKGYDLDDLYYKSWQHHKKIETVQKGVKKNTDELISKHQNIVFVGLQGKDQLTFSPDIVIILVRKDYENYYRQKLVRDLRLLCEDRIDYETVLLKEPIEEFRNHFWSNDIVNMKSFEEFKAATEKATVSLQKQFVDAHLLTAKEVVSFLKKKLT